VRNIDADQASRCSDGWRDGNGNFPCSGAHIKHLVAWLNIGRFEHQRYKKPGPPTGKLLIR